MSSGVMNFKAIPSVSSSKFYVISTGHTFEGQCTARLGSLDTAIGGSSKDVLYCLYIVRVFSSSELVEPHIIPLKVCLAVALKEEAKRYL